MPQLRCPHTRASIRLIDGDAIVAGKAEFRRSVDLTLGKATIVIPGGVPALRLRVEEARVRHLHFRYDLQGAEENMSEEAKGQAVGHLHTVLVLLGDGRAAHGDHYRGTGSHHRYTDLGNARHETLHIWAGGISGPSRNRISAE